MAIHVDRDRLWAELDRLAAFSAGDPAGGVTRRAWSAEYEAAASWLGERMREAGLRVATDAAGNLWGRWEEGALPAVVTGSHIDSVPGGGRFDGCLGVLGGLEAIRALREAGHQPHRQLWLVAFMEEEGSAFGQALFGSRALAGGLDLDAVAESRNGEGRTLRSTVEAAGRDWADLAALPERLRDIGAYLELHIEQGPVLEHDGTELGVVTGIVGIEWLRMAFSGTANHAGTTPMEIRADAGIGAARALLAVRDLAVERDLRATVGQMELSPGGTNVIPGRASFTVDARHERRETLADYREELVRACAQIALEEGLKLDHELQSTLEPVPLDADLQARLEGACEGAGATHRRMSSGAGHDAMMLAPHVPAGMLFVPSRGGVSHAPDEYSTPEHCALGASVLAQTLADLTTEGSA